MQMLIGSALATVALGWSLYRMERDHPLRLFVMAALGGASLWLVWALVDMAPMRAQPEPAWVRAPAPGPAPQGFWARLGAPGLTAARISLLLAVTSVVLVAWPQGHWSGRVLRTVLAMLVFGAGVLMLLGLGFSVMWSNGRDWPLWRVECGLLLLSLVLSAVAMVRLRVAEKGPMVLDARPVRRPPGR